MTQQRRVTKGDWAHQPMPKERAPLPLARHYTDEEYALIQRGFRPQGNDDKLFMYMEGDRLYVHRSAGPGQFELRFAPLAGGGVRIAEAWFMKYALRGEDAHDESEQIARQIDLLLIRRSRVRPLPALATQPLSERIRTWQGNLTAVAAEAIVNAANPSMLGGGGLDGAIHDAAGPELLVECRTLGGCAVGDAKLTRGYRLPAKHIIHAVGPVWHGGDEGEATQLASCYRRSLEIAKEQKFASIAFPALSTGALRYPIADAARVAVATVRAVLAESATPALVLLCAFDDRTYDALQNAAAD